MIHPRTRPDESLCDLSPRPKCRDHRRDCSDGIPAALPDGCRDGCRHGCRECRSRRDYPSRASAASFSKGRFSIVQPVFQASQSDASSLMRSLVRGRLCACRLRAPSEYRLKNNLRNPTEIEESLQPCAASSVRSQLYAQPALCAASSVRSRLCAQPALCAASSAQPALRKQLRPTCCLQPRRTLYRALSDPASQRWAAVRERVGSDM